MSATRGRKRAAAKSAHQGTDPLVAVRDWKAGVSRHSALGAESPRPAKNPTEASFIRGAEAKRKGANNTYWREFAAWVLSRAGLPAPEDCGERSTEAPQPALGEDFSHSSSGSRESFVYADTTWNRLARVLARVDPDSAESWAARVEWAFLAGQGVNGGGVSAIAEFLGALRLLPDATRARMANARISEMARVANEGRAKAAAAEDARWKTELVRARLWPLGQNGVTVKAGATHIADKYRLDPAKVYATLRKKRTKGKL